MLGVESVVGRLFFIEGVAELGISDTEEVHILEDE